MKACGRKRAGFLLDAKQQKGSMAHIFLGSALMRITGK